MKIQFIPYEDGSKQKAVEGAGNILNLDFAKPRPVGQVIPDWFKHLPAFIDRPLTPGAGTAKACRPLHEYLHYGYILPLWADYIFDYNELQNTKKNGTFRRNHFCTLGQLNRQRWSMASLL